MSTIVSPKTVLETRGATIRYGETAAVKDVNLEIPENQVLAIIGPSGCGKSTLLRSFNRMNDFISECTVEGEILFEGVDINGSAIDPVELRQRIGMVFQRPNPFPKSIRANITWAPKMAGYRGDYDELVERTLREAALWDESKDKLDKSALSLSGGQQQRLCIARSLAMSPEVLLMDEPCSALDPIATGPNRRTYSRAERALHSRHRDAQLATSWPHRRPDCIHVPRRVDRGRRNQQPLHATQEEEDRGLHYRSLRINLMTEHLIRDLQSIKQHVLGMAGLAEEALGLALSAYVERERGSRAASSARRSANRSTPTRY